VSRIGKKSISIPEGVTVTVTGNLIVVKGPKGELSREIHPYIRAEVRNKEVVVFPMRQSKITPALWGLFRTLVANMVEGVTRGFEKKLELEGIGYRVSLEDGGLLMQLGFSHPVRFDAPPGIKFTVEKNVVTVSGIDKELVGNTAASIRFLRPPEPYKGKGIKYRGEIIRRKAGKKAVASS
jgi:large subunit ribosomal protein L6